MAKKMSKQNKNMMTWIVIAVLVALVVLIFKFASRASDSTTYQTPSDASTYSSGDVDTDVSTLDMLFNTNSPSDFDPAELQ